ncbi:hypothetical protein [Streptomyces sp. MAR4 CNX-425]|uniref:hypothetical protein n=1 Tax=Streptomyces sp. MAR4 CNX-425 TaxID=3406343 RepID=UPI003B513FBC
MPLSVLTPPSPALRSVRAALKSPTAVRGFRTLTPTSGAGPAGVTDPLPVHVLDGVGPGDGPPRAALGGWRFHLAAEGRVVAAAEARITPDGWAFSHFSEGPYVASAQRALRQAESLPAVLQPRLLSVPELYMVTLWLRPDAGAAAEPDGIDPADLLVPLAPAPPGIRAHRAHRAGDLLPALRDRLAAARLLGSSA